MIRVCLVDDQTLVRQGIRSLLALDDGIEVVADLPQVSARVARLRDQVARDLAVKVALKAKDFSSKFPTITVSSNT